MCALLKHVDEGEPIVSERLDAVAGFALSFDPAHMQLETFDGVSFRPVSRTARDLGDVLREPEAIDPDREVYRAYYPVAVPTDVRHELVTLGLTYSFVMMPPLRVGREFVKTAGHYHPLIPDSPLAYPEVYTQLFGRLTLLLQRRDPADPERIDDCVVVDMVPGMVITLPPGYAHVLINTTDEPALMAGLYADVFQPDYGPIRRRRGMAYYVLAPDGDGIVVEPNPRYRDAPPLRRLTWLDGTPFAPIEPGIPLWQSFLRNPAAYAFLTQPEAVVAHFGKKDSYELAHG
jgi:glucose-6-phosphate isomerase